MGKKRKASGRPSGKDESNNMSVEDNKLRINTYEDVADSEDEFHINRDKILLEEGPAQKKQRKLREEEEFLEPSDEEVLVASEDLSESDDYLDDAQKSQELSHRQPEPSTHGVRPQDSDDEGPAALEEDEDAGGWGNSRKDYYDADFIETEADALEEEAEARRLQQKQLQGMTEADFGFDEADWLEASKDGDEEGQGKVVREVLPKLQITDAMGPEERLKILRTRYPEFEPLAREFLDLQPIYDDLKTAAAEATVIIKRTEAETNASVDVEETNPPFAVVKHSVLAAYLAALSMYFAIFTSGETNTEGKTTAMPPDELRDHAIMETLVQCRDLWQKVKKMVISESKIVGDDRGPISIEKISEAKPKSAHDASHGREDKPRKRKHRKSKAQKASEAAEAEAEALRVEKLRKTEDELADLSALTTLSKPPLKSSKVLASTARTDEDDNSDFGEQTSLTPHEAVEKANRKKSLRFYTSQIAQKSNKRDAAGRDAGGDADLPYRERLKDRQMRLNAEAEKRGKKPPKALDQNEDLGGASDEEDYATAQELRKGHTKSSDSAAEEEDYYTLIASRSASKKARKAALASAHAQAAKEGGIVRIVDDDRVGENGKRAISYQIEKNKGIMPKRKKEVRNSRVKKRKKFEEKKKKLGSVRAVWKGGEGRGGYGGELTGIKKGLVKSVKL